MSQLPTSGFLADNELTVEETNRRQAVLLALAQKGVSFANNIACDIVTAKFTHGTPINVLLKTLTIARTAIVIGASGQIPLFARCVMADAKHARVTVWFNTISATNTECTILLLPEGEKQALLPAYLPLGIAPTANGQVPVANSAAAGGFSWSVPTGSTSGFLNRVEFDFTTGATVDFKAGGDGNYTILDTNGVGHTFAVVGSAAMSTFKLLNGTGVQMITTGACDGYLRGKLTDLVTGINPLVTDDVEVWYHITGTTGSGNTNSNYGGILDFVNLWGCYGGHSSNAGADSFRWSGYYGGAAHLTGFDATTVTDDVLVFRLVNSQMAEMYTGQWSAGWPTTLRIRAAVPLGTLFTDPVAGRTILEPLVLGDLCTFAECNGNNANWNSMVYAHMKVLTK
jgi:hypothetical protein